MSKKETSSCCNAPLSRPDETYHPSDVCCSKCSEPVENPEREIEKMIERWTNKFLVGDSIKWSSAKQRDEFILMSSYLLDLQSKLRTAEEQRDHLLLLLKFKEQGRITPEQIDEALSKISQKEDEL